MIYLYSIALLATAPQQEVNNSAVTWLIGFIIVVFVVWLLISFAARQQPEFTESHHDESHDEHAHIEESPVEAIATTSAAPEPQPEQETAPEPEPEPEPDILADLEGIGPKVNSLLQAAGITTFVQLAETDVAKLNQILDDNKLQMLDPTSWPEQARLAADGKHDELQALQDKLKGGRKVE